MIMESKTKTSRLTKNNSGRHSNRFLQCFRTSEMDINGRDYLGHQNDVQDNQKPVFTYVDVGEKQAVVFPGILSDDIVDVDINRDKKKKKRVRGRKLLLLMRAAMFETSLVKKIRKKKQKQWQSDDNSLRKPVKSFNGNYLVQESSEDENVRTSSRSPPFGITSSCTSSISSNPRHRNSARTNSFRSNTTLEGKQDKDGKGFYGPNIGCCFLLISLFVLVFWGKVCAIVCTSTWLIFVPRRFRAGNVSLLKNVDGNAKVGSERYKKKVIMEGLLERNHSRGLWL